MEVKNISQGGQTSFDLNTNSIGGSGQVTIENNNYISIDFKSSEEHSSTGGNSNISEKDVKNAVDKFNKLIEDKSTHLEYEIYGKHKDLTIRIVDDKTKDVIKEIPPKKLIDMIDKFTELAGVFVDEKA